MFLLQYTDLICTVNLVSSLLRTQRGEIYILYFLLLWQHSLPECYCFSVYADRETNHEPAMKSIPISFLSKGLLSPPPTSKGIISTGDGEGHISKSYPSYLSAAVEILRREEELINNSLIVDMFIWISSFITTRSQWLSFTSSTDLLTDFFFAPGLASQAI